MVIEANFPYDILKWLVTNGFEMWLKLDCMETLPDVCFLLQNQN